MHLERPGLIRDNLHGLVQRKLGLVKPIKDFEEVNKQIKEGREVDIVQKYFSKTSDNVLDGMLMRKVGLHGNHSELAILIHNWLDGTK